LTVVTVLVYVS